MTVGDINSNSIAETDRSRDTYRSLFSGDLQEELHHPSFVLPSSVNKERELNQSDITRVLKS